MNKQRFKCSKYNEFVWNCFSNTENTICKKRFWTVLKKLQYKVVIKIRLQQMNYKNCTYQKTIVQFKKLIHKDIVQISSKFYSLKYSVWKTVLTAFN